MYFNPRSPRGGATRIFLHHQTAFIFQSTLPTRGSDYAPGAYRLDIINISIHAPHEGERRCGILIVPSGNGYFNPRSPRGGATIRADVIPHRAIYFNPRSPRGGATILPIRLCSKQRLFQSTLPTRGSDSDGLAASSGILYFNPRSPRGGATCPIVHRTRVPLTFQSTLPTRGSDLVLLGLLIAAKNFNPRSPRGGATVSGRHGHAYQAISIHAPHEGERLIRPRLTP